MGPFSLSWVLPTPPPLPPRLHQPKDSHRQASCTHTHMVRIWQDFGEHYCHLCQRHQLIGWVYRCVQDHDGYLPQSDFTSLTLEPRREFEPDWEVTLSDWIVAAIDKGEYTQDQVQKLVEQKIGVKRAILAQAASESPPSSSCSTDLSNITASAAGHSTFSTLPTTPDEELRTPDDQEKAGTLSSRLSYSESTATRLSVQIQACGWKCCHACRPTYRDRAWELLDKVVNEPYQQPPRWELENRPISDATLVARMGLSEPQDTYDEFQYLFNAKLDKQIFTQVDSTESGHKNVHTQRRTHSFRDKSDFEKAVRGVISLGKDYSGFVNQHNRQMSSSSSHGSLISASRSMLFIKNAPDSANTQASTHTGSSASQVSLAHTIKESGEVEVHDGVAVTEEAVKLGRADIIMQV